MCRSVLFFLEKCVMRWIRNKLSKCCAVLLPAVLCMLFFVGCAAALTPYPDEEIDTSWVVEEMHVQIVVAEDKTAAVTETLRVRFGGFYDKHGIYRDLPLDSGEKYRGIKTSHHCAVERSNKLLSLRLGSENRVYSPGAEDTFTIGYTVIPPKKSDPTQYYMNVIGFGFSTEIETATVEMTFPAAIADMQFAVGRTGAIGDGGRVSVEKSSDGKKVTLTVAEGLAPYEGVTAGLTFPKNTFRKYRNTEFIGVLIAGIVLLGVVIVLLVLLGRDKPIVPITSYYPPADKEGKPLSPVRIGTLIDGACSSEDVTSMIFYWASKGYLRLEEVDDEMKLTKCGDLPDGTPSYERRMFNKLFENGQEVLTGQLKEKFYPAITDVKRSVSAECRGQLYDGKAGAASIVAAVLTAIFGAGMTLLAYRRVSTAYFAVPIAAVAVVSVALFMAGIALTYNRVKLRAKYWPLLFGYLLLIIGAYCACIIPIARDVMAVPEKVLLICFGVAATCIAPFIMRRKDGYTKTLGEIVGFRDFLLLAEKDKLEMLLEDNPQYYYDILPYANVLGVSDVWQDKFKELNVPPPVYYDSSDVFFNIMIFNAFYRRSFIGFRTAATTRPASSSHSGGGIHFGGGGGGFHGGGGFGGGGGRSW